LLLLMSTLLLSSCARIGSPDGGWYDEAPPRVMATDPVDGSTGVDKQKINIYFNEYVTIENATENVVISPAQIEAPEIKSKGKSIVVQLKDSLKPDMTYTIDFSDAISDNNESNPLGNYTYSFSTGDHIDTLEVSGYVVNAEDLEPMSGVVVGLYDDLADSVVSTKPMVRVGRTNDEGHFIIRGVAPGKYRAYALKDMDGDYMFTQKGEALGFNDFIFEPTWKPDIRQDTLWADSLHIANIERVHYTHFLPDDIVLRAFTHTLTDRQYIKSERKEADHFSLFFSYGSDTLPSLRGLNFDSDSALMVEPSATADTITYWIKDTSLVNQDTLQLELSYMATDTTGMLVPRVDTLEVLAKTSYERRMKEKEKEIEKWQKEQNKKKKRGEKYDSIYPPEKIKLRVNASSQMDPDQNVTITSEVPLGRVDTTKIHLYLKNDTLWDVARYELVQDADTAVINRLGGAMPPCRQLILRAEWRPEQEYSLECDSAAFSDIYGLSSDAMKNGFKVSSLDSYGTLIVNMSGMSGKHVVVTLLNESGKEVKRAVTDEGSAEFFYVKEGSYFLSMFIDENGNGKWDTGDYSQLRQPEMVYYYPESVECKAKWDVTKQWNVEATPAYHQKPAKLKKAKGSQKRKTVKTRNLERARNLGIQYIPKV